MEDSKEYAERQEQRYAEYEAGMADEVHRRRHKHLVYVAFGGIMLGVLLGYGLVASTLRSEDEIAREWLEDNRGRGFDDEINRVISELWRMEALEGGPRR